VSRYRSWQFDILYHCVSSLRCGISVPPMKFTTVRRNPHPRQHFRTAGPVIWTILAPRASIRAIRD
jgi:hypothetical protein